jgi:uncharacterized protein (TIGR02145 family)
MNTTIKTGIAAILLLVISCKKENNIVQSSAVTNNTSAAHFIKDNNDAGTSGTVKIGLQVWMQENLDVSHYRNGDSIPEIKDPVAWAETRTGAWCWYNNDSVTGASYGKLYNWYAVNDPRGLAPTGWHVASDAEWDTLITFLGNHSIAGGKMKEAGTIHWLPPNTDATNVSGFTGLPGGHRFGNGDFGYIRLYGIWWSSTQYQAFQAWYRVLRYNTAFIYRSHHAFTRRYGFSVRCIQD